MHGFAAYRKIRRRYVKKFGKRTFRALAGFMSRESLVDDLPVFDKTEFSFTAELERNAHVIRAELEDILKSHDHLPTFHEISRDQRKISKGDSWKTYMLFGFGYRAERNCARCPETIRLLGRVPGIQNAFFSILSPGYHIPPHRGVTKGVIRCHLALIVPDQAEKCVMRVADQTCQWREGECLVFDDTYDHEIRNDTDQLRAVLLFDFARPMRLPGRLLSRGLMFAIKWSAYVQEARKNNQEWEDRFEAAVYRADALQIEADESEHRLD